MLLAPHLERKYYLEQLKRSLESHYKEIASWETVKNFNLTIEEQFAYGDICMQIANLTHDMQCAIEASENHE